MISLPNRFLYTFFCLLICAGPWSLAAQDDVHFTAELDRRQVQVGGRFQLSFTLHNADGKGFQAPSFGSFEVLAGPNISQQTSFVNGDMSSATSYIFVLSPVKAGVLTIGPAQIRANGKILRSASLQIEVLPAGEASTAPITRAKGDFFMVAAPSTRQAWVGQQITLDFKLYTRLNVGNLKVVKEADFSGFYAQNLRDAGGNAEIEEYQGRQYYVQTIHRVLLYPQKTGNLQVGTMQIQLQAAEESEDPFFGGFFRKMGPPQTLQSAPLAIQVKALPQPAPADFSGIIGKYQVSWDAPHRQITTDDAFTLRLTMDGSGDPKLLQAPNISFPEGWEAYDPKILEQAGSGEKGYINNHAVFEYVAIPQKTGADTVLAHFSWFNPQSGKYENASSPLKVEVTAGNGNPTVTTPPLSGNAPQVEDDPRASKIPWRKIFNYGLILAIIVGFIGWNRRQKQIPSGTKKRYQAARHEQVQSGEPETTTPEVLTPLPVIHREIDPQLALYMRLQDVEQSLGEQDIAQFFKGLGDWLKEWAVHKSISATEWSAKSLESALRAQSTPEAVIQSALQIYKACEMYRYGGLMPPHPLQDLVDQANNLLQQNA